MGHPPTDFTIPELGHHQGAGPAARPATAQATSHTGPTQTQCQSPLQTWTEYPTVGTRILPEIYGYFQGISDSISYPYPGVPYPNGTRIRPDKKILVSVSENSSHFNTCNWYPSCFHPYHSPADQHH
jgi:hypothetical protein